MQTSYPLAIKAVLAHEGGYTHHPDDPGGPTNWGITIADARLYWKASATAADVKAMPLSAAQSIYDKHYWDSQRCDDLPPGLDYCVFDYGVNSGIGRSGKVLRRLVGLPDATSRIDDAVIAAVAQRYPQALIRAMCDERLRFLKSLKTWPTFGDGWARRVAEVRALALHMAASPIAQTTLQPPITPTAATETMAKGAIRPPPIGRVAAGAATGGVVGVGVPQTGVIAWMTAHPGPSVFIGLGCVVAIGAVCEVMLTRHDTKQTTPMPGTEAVPAAA